MVSASTQESILRDSSIPADDQLKGLSLLLSVDKMKLTVADILKVPADRISDCSINYIRYKPSTNCLAAYSVRVEKNTEKNIEKNADKNSETTNHLSGNEIIFYGKCFTESDYSNAASKVSEKRWIDNDSNASVNIIDEKNIILYFFPNDALLEGLRILSDPRKIQRLLYEKLDSFPQEIWRISDRHLKVSPVRYKPERRAVLRCETRATHRETKTRKSITAYARIYSDSRGENIYALMKHLHGQTHGVKGLSTPRPLGYISERNLILMESIPGKPLGELISERDCEVSSKENILRAIYALALLHKVSVPKLKRRDSKDYRDEIRASSRTLSELLPDYRDEIEIIAHSLNQALPTNESGVSGFTHGDFHPGQVLLTDSSVGILDFDRSCNGEQDTDLAEFIANLRMSAINCAQPLKNGLESHILEAYFEGSGRKPDRNKMQYWIAQRLFLQAVTPFRRMDSNWKDSSKRILKECQAILTSL